ncbi:hypothetical protein LCGC14_1358170 [marine sediment metagenome]|uniref:Uncharacterized protein n=1 Tax=marine sediment metagenome TaxID=412755 RepID=A0A0F9K8U2_9ZZZZ
MQYGTKKSTGPFSLTIQIRNEPRCPGCAEFLQPCVVEFRDGWAWCQVCIAMGLHLEPWIATVLEGESMQECRTVAKGLSFYTPELPWSAAKSAYEWYEETMGEKCLSETTDEPDGLYLQLPGGLAPIAELDMTGLRELEEDMQRIRHSRSPEAAIRPDDTFAVTPAGQQVLRDFGTSNYE